MKKPWWQFWKKEEPKKTGRVLVVPEEHTLHIFELIDTFNSKTTGEDRVARYILWTSIHRLFPETKRGNWKLNHNKATEITITENLA